MPQTQSPKRKPVIGLCGFYGHGNYGDELFLDVHKQTLGADFDLKIIPSLLEKPYFERPLAELVAGVDAILIGGGDLVRPWGVDVRYFHRLYLTKPVFIAGVGVPVTIRPDGSEQETPHSINKYREFFCHPNVKFLNVRDPASRTWMLEKIDPDLNVIESPDLVCALDLPPVTRPAGPKILGLATRDRPGHVDDYSQLDALAAHAMAEGWKIRHIILGNGVTGRRDMANSLRLNIPGKETVYSESLDDMSRAIGECSALASMKFHGSVVATMYNVPSVVLVPTMKNVSFMKRIGREELVSRFDANLVDLFTPFPAPHAPEAIAELRQRAAGMLQQLKDALVQALC